MQDRGGADTETHHACGFVDRWGLVPQVRVRTLDANLSGGTFAPGRRLFLLPDLSLSFGLDLDDSGFSRRTAQPRLVPKKRARTPGTNSWALAKSRAKARRTGEGARPHMSPHVPQSYRSSRTVGK